MPLALSLFANSFGRVRTYCAYPSPLPCLFSEIFLNSILGNSTSLITHKKNIEVETAAQTLSFKNSLLC